MLVILQVEKGQYSRLNVKICCHAEQNILRRKNLDEPVHRDNVSTVKFLYHLSQEKLGTGWQMSPGEFMPEDGLLSLDQVNEGGDTEVLPLGGENPSLPAADLTNTMLVAEADPTKPQAAEPSFSQDERREVVAEGLSVPALAGLELPMETTAILNDLQGSGQEASEMVAMGKLHRELTLHEQQLDGVQAAHALLGSDNESPSSIDSMSSEEGLSSPDSEEGEQEAADQTGQLLDLQDVVLAQQTEDLSDYEGPSAAAWQC